MAHGALLNVMWLPDEKAVWRRMDTCRCVVESLHCSPETITMLLIGSTTIQNKKLKKKCVCVCVCVHFGKGQGRGMEKEMATHSSALAWKIPGTEEPGGLQSMGSRKIGHE